MSSSSPSIGEGSPPITKNHERSALLFVDISGFTRLSVTLDVESLSNAINSYFEMIVDIVEDHGGNILKFAGDAIFAKWIVSSRCRSNGSLGSCVLRAARCASAIVVN